MFNRKKTKIAELKEEIYRRDCDLEGANERIEKLQTALAWLISEVKRDHKLDRLSIDSEDCVRSAEKLLLGK